MREHVAVFRRVFLDGLLADTKAALAGGAREAAREAAAAPSLAW